jgi:ankyrin repeat protein
MFATIALLFALSAPSDAATRDLLAAAASGDRDGILAAIAANANVNARDDDKNTPLILLAEQSLFGRERQIVEALVAAKADVNAANKDGITALMNAAAAGRDGMVRLLLQNGAKVNARDTDGWSALTYAANGGESSVVKELIEAEADVNAADRKGWTPLMLALFHGRGSVSEKLLKASAKMPAKAPNGFSAILLAAYGRDLAGVRQVLESGAPLDGRDNDGWTALEVASYNGDGQIVMELLRAGADASLNDKENKTALDRAKENTDAEVIAILGGPWSKPALKAGTTITIPCEPLGGNVEANFRTEKSALVVTTVFPHPVTFYLGGGNTNRAASARKLTYEGSFSPAYYLDTDSNEKTGATKPMFKEATGSEYSIDYSQYGTSVSLPYKDSEGNVHSRSVYANVLSVDVSKQDSPIGTSLDTSSLGDDAPAATNADGVLITKVPLKLLKIAPGKSVRVTAKVGTCPAVVSRVKL